MLLDIENLRTSFRLPTGVVRAVNGVSLGVAEGESLGIVGESGSGKSVMCLSLLGLIRRPGYVEGRAVFGGLNLITADAKQLRQIRGKEIGMVFQDPMTSLNPTLRIGTQIAEAFLWHHLCTRAEARKKAIELLERVGIPDAGARVRDFPFQFSGGMRQRVMIALALACRPKLIIADEPTTALDVTIQAQILDLLKDMKSEFNTSIIMITHNFGVTAEFCDRVAVMYAGRIVEIAPIGMFIGDALHPYSQGLLESNSDPDMIDRRINPIPGSPPDMTDVPTGCAFHPRCTRATEICTREVPALVEMQPEHNVACWAAGRGNE